VAVDTPDLLADNTPQALPAIGATLGQYVCLRLNGDTGCSAIGITTIDHADMCGAHSALANILSQHSEW
jgi:hypothetical protein